MFTFRRLLSCSFLLPLAALAGCSLLPGGPAPQEKRYFQGGFSVRVDGPGLPSAKSVAADIGTFAQQRGFVRQSARSAPSTDPATHEPLPAPPERYVMGSIVLEVSRQAAERRVSAYLHGSGPEGDRKFIDRFDRGFDQQYAGRYGGTDRISETAYADDVGSRGGSAGTLGAGAVPDSSSPLQSGVPPVSNAPGESSGPAGRP